MKNTTQKKGKNPKNTTKKQGHKSVQVENLTEKQKEIICKKAKITFKSFEEKIDELFKQNKMDITSSSFNLEKQIVSELKKAVSPSNITPNNDFYSYINERWLQDLDIEAYQEYITQVDNFRLIQDKVYREIIQIIEEYLSDPKTKNTPKAKCMRNAYESFKIYNSIEQTQAYANFAVEYIDKLRESQISIWSKLAFGNMNEIISWGSPFVWSINPDDKNPKKYKCYLEPPQLTLLDVNIYFDDETDSEEDKKYKNKYRKRYLQYLADLFKVAFGENHDFNVKDVYDTEVELINAMACSETDGGDPSGYNLITKDEALKVYGFDWAEFCKNIGFKKVPNDFVTSNINYLKCGTRLMTEKWDSPQWRTYWIYIYIRQLTRLNQDGEKVFFDFHGSFLRGQEGNIDQALRAFFGMSFTFNTFLTNEYILRYKNQQAIDYLTSMVQDLRRVFVRILKRNTWLQPKTKQIAIEKLEAIKLIVGSPEILRDDPLLDYTPDDPWGNLVKMSSWRHERAIELTGKDVIDIPVIDWSNSPPKLVSTQAYVVNAMYTPTQNSIYIPLGYIQKPFIDLDERGIEYNLAHIGFTIGHEMSHALDDWGSKYDKNGVLYNWWTKKDAAQFRKIQEDIVNQYQTMALKDGIKFDAWPSIGEDIADISGFTMCLEYLRDFQLKNQDILPIQSLSFEAFFIYFALQSRQKISKKAILAQLKTNPHPLDKFRCNVPLSRSKVFRAMFKVKKGDNMWWPSTSTVWAE
jgi:putative endopeptidase